MRIGAFICNNSEYFENFITRCTYHSNAIEGSTLSYADTYAIIFNDNSFKINAEPREIYDAINHKYALSYIINNLNIELSERLIKDIAIQINKNTNEIDGYRTSQVYIRGAEYIPPAPQQLNQMMMYFVYNYNHTFYDDIFKKTAEKHIEFERIHPFSDGNGRTGRLLINYEMLRNDFPPIVIPKERRTEYFSYIADADVEKMSQLFSELSNEEYQLMKKFGYDDTNNLSLESNKHSR